MAEFNNTWLLSEEWGVRFRVRIRVEVRVRVRVLTGYSRVVRISPQKRREEQMEERMEGMQ